MTFLILNNEFLVYKQDTSVGNNNQIINPFLYHYQDIYSIDLGLLIKYGHERQEMCYLQEFAL